MKPPERQDHDRVRVFWNGYDGGGDIDERLAEAIAAARRHGEAVGLIRGRNLERDLGAKLDGAIAAVIADFIRGYGYNGWFRDHLPKPFMILVDKLLAAKTWVNP